MSEQDEMSIASDDLFVVLYGHGRNTGKSVSENFVSALVAMVFVHDKQLAQRVLWKLWDIHIPDEDMEKMEIRTEAAYAANARDSFIDIEIKTPSALVWIECKVGAKLNTYEFETAEGIERQDQIKKYLDALAAVPRESARSKHLVVLARDLVRRDGNGDYYRGSRTWAELDDLIRAFEPGDATISTALRRAAIRFFERYGLERPLPIRRDGFNPAHARQIVAMALSKKHINGAASSAGEGAVWSFFTQNHGDVWLRLDEHSGISVERKGGMLDIRLRDDFWQLETVKEQVDRVADVIDAIADATVINGVLQPTEILAKLGANAGLAERVLETWNRDWRRTVRPTPKASPQGELKVPLPGRSAGGCRVSIVPSKDGGRIDIWPPAEDITRCREIVRSRLELAGVGTEVASIKLSSLDDDKASWLGGVLAALYPPSPLADAP